MVIFQTQNDIVLGSLLNFYRPDPVTLTNPNFTKMSNIVLGKSRISLRLIDWFATNYAKKNYTSYTVPHLDGRFKVHNSYKLHLKSYTKERFDPFCRQNHTCVSYNSRMTLDTTIGQLNFFKWALENGIIDYIEEHFDEIEQDMNQRNSASRRKTMLDGTLADAASNIKTRKKRQELSTSAAKVVKKESANVVVSFH